MTTISNNSQSILKENLQSHLFNYFSLHMSQIALSAHKKPLLLLHKTPHPLSKKRSPVLQEV